MSKVEELRERLIQAIGTYGVAEDKGMPSELCETLDSLIAAAKEEEREGIRNANGVLRLENDDAHAVWVTAGEYFILPASLLSPAPKEVSK